MVTTHLVSGATSGLPVDASLRIEYGHSSDGGAVLITSSPVTRNGYCYESPFHEWVQANARALLHSPIGADIKEHGLFVVTQTHATEKVALTAWQRKENKAYFGFGAGATGLGEISPRVQWFTGRSESGWNLHEAELGESKVVFAAGLAYRRTWPAVSLRFRSSIYISYAVSRISFTGPARLPVVLQRVLWRAGSRCQVQMVRTLSWSAKAGAILKCIR